MSTFNFKLEYPEIDYSWQQVNEDGTPKCPANWVLDDLTEFFRYFLDDETWILLTNFGEGFTIPITTNDISLNESSKIIFSHTTTTSGYSGEYLIKFIWNDVGDHTYKPFLTIGEYLDMEVDIPSYAEYIKIESPDNADIQMEFQVAIDFEIKTPSYEINTEQNDVTIKTNNKSSLSLANTILTTSLSKRDVFYKNELTIKNEDEQALNNLIDLARMNKLLVSVNINISDSAGSNLANIPSGGLDNKVKYWYMGHGSSQKTGLYSYINLSYKNNNKNLSTYI